MISDFANVARKAMRQNIIEMALDFTGMTRIFAKGSNPRILEKLDDVFGRFESIVDQADYDQIHSDFCNWFTQNIQVAEKKLKKSQKTIRARKSSYGQAAKVLDIAAKVYVYYCALPPPEAVGRLLPLLHGGLDNQIVKHLVKKFPEGEIKSESLEDVDHNKYQQLQALVRREIQNDFQSSIHPVQHDDIFFRELNRRPDNRGEGPHVNSPPVGK